jgi:hypothetical protein
MLSHHNRRATPPGRKSVLRSLSNDAAHRRNLGPLRPPLPRGQFTLSACLAGSRRGVALRKPLGGQANNPGGCSLPCPPDMAACLTRRLLACSPATRLRRTPRQRISESDHSVQMWSNTGLIELRWRLMRNTLSAIGIHPTSLR